VRILGLTDTLQGRSAGHTIPGQVLRSPRGTTVRCLALLYTIAKPPARRDQTVQICLCLMNVDGLDPDSSRIGLVNLVRQPAFNSDLREAKGQKVLARETDGHLSATWTRLYSTAFQRNRE